MQAFGSDRVRTGDGEQIVLSSRISKGWTARVEKTLTSAEFPGTAVLWEERYFEVVVAEVLQHGGVRYVLEPWRDHHAMRVSDRYDAESEANRIEEYRKHLVRESSRKTANLAGMITGNLPAVVQEHLGRELGILPPRLTLISIVAMWALIAGIVLFEVSAYMKNAPVPFALFIALIYLGVESVIRFLVNWTQSRPIGSTLGWIGYALFHFITGRGPSPFTAEKGQSIATAEPAEEIAQQDAFAVREPFITLLTPAEQARVAQRFGYDYRRESTAVALTLFAIGVVGVVSSFMRHAAIALIVAGALAAEQVIRLASFRQGPSGSVLRFLVRPFMRKVL